MYTYLPTYLGGPDGVDVLVLGEDRVHGHVFLEERRSELHLLRRRPAVHLMGVDGVGWGVVSRGR